MKNISEPKQEKQVLASVREDAKPEDIQKGIEERAEGCVVHLCGCKD